MPLAITAVSGASGAKAAVCQANMSTGVVIAGYWVDQGVRPAQNLNIQIVGWKDDTIVHVWTSQGSSCIAYKFSGSSYDVQQTTSGGQPTTLWTGPTTTTSLALTINSDGSLSMTEA